MKTLPSDIRERRTVVVIGNGMVGHRFCQQLTEYDVAGAYSIVVLGEERRPAYDRVRLTSYLSGTTVDELTLGGTDWYSDRGIDLRTGTRAARIDLDARYVETQSGARVRYDFCVIATGSAPFVPPIAGTGKEGVFVYRTIEDLDAIAAYANGVHRAAVVGGGLLGLEAAKAVLDLGLETFVVEFAPRLMPRQLNARAADMLTAHVEALGVKVLLERATREVCGNGHVTGLAFAGDDRLDVDMVVISAGIRPRDEIARQSGLGVGERGGICVDDTLQTSHPGVFAIGEVALHRGNVYGLVGPGYEMADCLAANLTGQDRRFTGGDVSTKLKLLGVDVATFGDPFASAQEARTVEFSDPIARVYKSLMVNVKENRIVGGTLVGDAARYAELAHMAKQEIPLDGPAELILFPGSSSAAQSGLPDSAQVCSCNNVTKGCIREAISGSDATTIGALKSCTRAGTGCGGCVPLVTRILDDELKRLGRGCKRTLCPHFDYTRQELFQVVRVLKYRSFGSLIRDYGRGDGCEVCKPAIASILASLWNESITNDEHHTLQDTNDRFLANIQRRGLYSVVPRVPGGEITPEKLIVLGEVARHFGLYAKITGGQRIDLLGARVDQLPQIWAELVAAGFESGHAYGKAVRTVKSCVGTTWCRYGVQDSVAFAIRIENRYKGIRAPHKIKMAVSGCVRECAEAQGKDIGLIATEKGWNLYVCGNGGAKPRHADLFAADLDEATSVRFIDRVLMYYIHTADKLTRTATWLETLEGGIEQLRRVVIDDALGICGQLDEDMERLIGSYRCEWTEVVNDPQKRALFRHHTNCSEADATLEFVAERGQRRPADWAGSVSAPDPACEDSDLEWTAVGRPDDFPTDGGSAVRCGSLQIAVFRLASHGTWYATQNRCPHKHDMVLARGIVGDSGGEPKVACPMHKKTFSLESGNGLTDPDLCIRTFPVKVESGVVYVKVPRAGISRGADALQPALRGAGT